ncbi:MAG: histone deacetylase [Candidatus Melainabacteria bacterium]|jgi:acetoin utilization deacetylase AcuC-like enzyme|nr:histone deacetylase [Candidatus Melainabacteria bacterium]
MSKMVLIRDPRFKKHQTPDAHPESPSRLSSIDNVIAKWALAQRVNEVLPRKATFTDIARVHKESYVEELKDKAERASRDNSLIKLDLDTYMGSESFEIAQLAAGAGLAAVDAVTDDPSNTHCAFVAVRPPGHHALVDAPMGFCLFNNVALAARYAQKERGYQRVFIIDWDVHHGNGTQWAFYDDPSVFFTSFQQYPFWPFDSGWYLEDGQGEGRGYNMNIPLPKGTGDRGYLKAFDALVRPILLEFNPDLILVSAGYDAHQEDPLGSQRISTPGYAMLSQRVKDLADELEVPAVVFLEGGYNVKTLADSAVATMRVLNAQDEAECGAVHASYLMPMSAANSNHVTGDQDEVQVDERIEEIRRHFKRYWRSLR